MARIQIDDLPPIETLSAEEQALIFGAGRFRPSFEALEERQLMSTATLPAMPSTAAAAVQSFQPSQSMTVSMAALQTSGHIPAPGSNPPIEAKYQQLGGSNSFLGKPLGWHTGDNPADIKFEMQGANGSRFVHYQNGTIFWSAATGAHEVHGAIRDEWASKSWERGFLGLPTTDELTCADGVGRYSAFQNGSIFWSPRTGAHEVHGAIREKWASLGWERGFLGYPTSDETNDGSGGRYNTFQGGMVSWTQWTGAHEVHGAIYQKWVGLGWAHSNLGHPISDEMDTPDHAGRYSKFEHGAIGWTPSTGALVIDKVSQFASERKTIDGDGYPYLGSTYEVLAPHTGGPTVPGAYNCIAWSLGITNRWVWPGDRVSDFDKLDGQYGYHRMSTLDFSLQRGIQKIVLYGEVGADGTIKCTHQAKQMADGSWTSKLGGQGLIRHLTPGFIDGAGYGRPVAVYWKYA